MLYCCCPSGWLHSSLARSSTTSSILRLDCFERIRAVARRLGGTLPHLDGWLFRLAEERIAILRHSPFFVVHHNASIENSIAIASVSPSASWKQKGPHKGGEADDGCGFSMKNIQHIGYFGNTSRSNPPPAAAMYATCTLLRSRSLAG